MKNISELNIYPLNEENLQALLDYFFPHLPNGNVTDLCEELKKYNLTLIELEYSAIKLLPYISKIKYMLGNNPTQTNALEYSINIFFDLFSEKNISPGRAEIIKTIKGIDGQEEYYENLASSNPIFFNNWVWN
jgi:hypothetical protein